MQLNNIDLNAIAFGEGEWINMQDVVRKSFILCFSQMKIQQEQISKLNQQLTQYKEQTNELMSSKVSLDDLATNLKVAQHGINREDSLRMDRIEQSIAKMNSELNRKVTTEHVNTLMKLKVDKSDAVIKKLLSIKENNSDHDTKKIVRTMEDLVGKCDYAMKKSSEVGQQLQLALSQTSEIPSLKLQMKDLVELTSQFYTKQQINGLLNQKLSANQMDILLVHKVDLTKFNEFISQVEYSLSEHESLLTKLNLR
eukprot:gene12676-16995_t